MNKIIKCLTFVLTAAVLLALASCQQSEEDPKKSDQTTSATTTAATTAATTAPKKEYVKQSLSVAEHLNDVFRPLGRTYVKENRLFMDFACTGIEFTAECEGTVKVEIFTSGWQKKNRFTVYVDGERMTNEPLVENAGTGKMVTVASNLPAGVHTIRVVNQTQFIWAQASFGKVELTGEFAAKPAERELFLEFYGDSILNGSNVRMGGGGVLQTDATQAFGWETAERLGADMNLVGCSAIGLTKNSRDFFMKDIWDWSGAQYSKSSGTGGNLVRDGIPKYDFARIPNAVIIEQGENDGSNASTAAFKTALTEMINNLRAKYGADVPIVVLNGYTEGPYNTSVPTIISELGGESANLYVCNLSNASVPTSAGGDGTHPNIKTTAKMVDELTAFLKDLLKLS